MSASLPETLAEGTPVSLEAKKKYAAKTALFILLPVFVFVFFQNLVDDVSVVDREEFLK